MGTRRRSNNINVPSADNTSNNTVADVIGNKNDGSNNMGNETLYNWAVRGYQHYHQPANVYPDLADSILLTAGNTVAWGLGSFTEIIPANAIASSFDIHWVMISDISASDEYQLNLYSGASGSEVLIASIAFFRDSIFAQEGNLPIQVPIQAANARISAKLACGDGDGATCRIKTYYHTYA